MEAAYSDDVASLTQLLSIRWTPNQLDLPAVYDNIEGQGREWLNKRYAVRRPRI